MSKVEAQRALRDARYAAYYAKQAAAASGPPPARATTPKPPARSSDATKDSVQPTGPAEDPNVAAAAVEADTTSALPDGAPALCGHRNIGNKECQRPAGHTEKNHRYK